MNHHYSMHCPSEKRRRILEPIPTVGKFKQNAAHHRHTVTDFDEAPGSAFRAVSTMNRRTLIASAAALGTVRATAAPAIDPDMETPVARLHSIIIALTARVDASTGDENCPDFVALCDRLHDAEMQMAKAPAQTTQDMALKAWFMRDYLHNAGTIYDVILADVARVVGPEAVRELDAMNTARHRNDQRSAKMVAAFGPDLEGLTDLPLSERAAAIRAAGITI